MSTGLGDHPDHEEHQQNLDTCFSEDKNGKDSLFEDALKQLTIPQSNTVGKSGESETLLSGNFNHFGGNYDFTNL